MTRKTITALLAQADATLPDNTTGAITPAALRAMVRDIVDTFTPAAAALGNASLTMAALGLTPRAVIYTDTLWTSTEYEVVRNVGTIKRLPHGLPATVNRARFFASLGGPSGAEVTFAIYRDGVKVTGGSTTVTGGGAGNFAQASIVDVDMAADGAEHTYDVRAAKITGATDDIQLTDVRFSLEVLPTM